MTDNDTFYDIHMHAFNLSHPSFSLFIKRFKISNFLLVVLALLSPLLLILVLPFLLLAPRVITYFTDRILRKVRNLLSLMESDIGSFFLITENCLRELPNQLLKDDGLNIGGTTYQRIVLTPLMMDFGYKSKKEDKTVHYPPSEKPIVSQVVDVFNAIRKYRISAYTTRLVEKFPYLGADTSRIFEIYPFLGLNTKNYKIQDLEKMLEKYFRDYQRQRDDFQKELGQFDGDIEHLKSNYFAGVKVYPPLGFDPWPKDTELLDRVKYLYEYCSRKQIPITSHGSTGGFVTVSRKQKRHYNAIAKWKEVLTHYPSLKLNIAHFPANGKRFGFLPPAEKDRLDAIIPLVQNYENVYVDFSNRGTDDKYYRTLRRVIDSQPDEKQRTKLTGRILFGSDFCINLFSVDSYNKYLQIFSRTQHLTEKEKHLFCSINPQRFLFS
jgi:predicted TIM-barrel fold metal-dependent hydrolase